MQNLDLSTATLNELLEAHTDTSVKLSELMHNLGCGNAAGVAAAKETAEDLTDIEEAVNALTTKPSEPIGYLLALHIRASSADKSLSKRVARINELRASITDYIAPAPRDELRALQAQRALELGDLPRSSPHANDARIEEILTALTN
jgi:hypothetical protein